MTNPISLRRYFRTRFLMVSAMLCISILAFTSVGLSPTNSAGTGNVTPDVEFLPYMANGYRFMTIAANTTPPSGYELPTFNDAAWSTGQAAFGFSVNYCPLTNTNVRTAWPPNTQLLARRSVELPEGATNV